MKRIISVILCVILCTFSFTGCGKDGSSASPTGGKNQNTNANHVGKYGYIDSASGKYSKGKHSIEIVVKDYGTIKVELDADTAPITVMNFCNLVNDGFYDGLTFHRIISGFVIQGGDPDHNGTGGSEYDIKGEFAANGVKNDIAHVRGVISMARATDPNSASSQFFICHQDARDSLDGLYAAFGHVTEGMDIVDKICQVTPVQDDNGTVLFQNQPIIKYIKIVD